MSQKSIKICYIGGGSRYWAYQLMSDLALCPEIDGEIALYDIDKPAAKHNVGIGNAIFRHDDAKTTFKVSAADKLEDALDGADFVVASIEPGPITMRYAELEIPKKYGILMSVGDTFGPGGLIRALRTMPTHFDFAHRIMSVCPDAWVINYTNPMTLCTQALCAAEPDIKVIGCCHEVFGTQNRLGNLVKEWFDLEEKPARHDIKLDVSGVNHFTLVTKAAWNGHDLFPRLREMIAQDGFFASRKEEADKRKEEGQWFGSNGLIAFDFLRRFGVLGAAGDRHLAEFVPWYLTSEENLHRWGVVLTPYSWRKENREKPPMEVEEVKSKPVKPSGEEGVQQMLALLGLDSMVTNVNMPNRGQMPDYPEGHVVETYAHIRQDSITPLLASPLPQAIDAHMHRVVEVQFTALAAAVEKSKELALQALLLDPLVHLSTDDAAKMLDEMFEHCAEMMEGWR